MKLYTMNAPPNPRKVDLLLKVNELDINDIHNLQVINVDIGKNEQNSPEFFGGYGPFDGIKRDTWEGGMRVPVIARWPGRIGRTWRRSTRRRVWRPTNARPESRRRC